MFDPVHAVAERSQIADAACVASSSRPIALPAVATFAASLSSLLEQLGRVRRRLGRRRGYDRLAMLLNINFVEAGCDRPRLAIRGMPGGGLKADTAESAGQALLAIPIRRKNAEASGEFFRASEVHPKVHRRVRSCGSSSKSLIEWRSLRESNPCFSLERAKTGRPSAIEDIIASFPKVPPGPRLRRRRRTHTSSGRPAKRGSALRKCVRVNVHWGEERQRIPTAG